MTRACDVPYTPMSLEELQDLEREAGRQLTVTQAIEYRKRKAAAYGAEGRLEEKVSC